MTISCRIFARSCMRKTSISSVLYMYLSMLTLRWPRKISCSRFSLCKLSAIIPGFQVKYIVSNPNFNNLLLFEILLDFFYLEIGYWTISVQSFELHSVLHSVGLFVAGVFSGALSTVSSGLNSLSAVALRYRRDSEARIYIYIIRGKNDCNPFALLCRFWPLNAGN